MVPIRTNFGQTYTVTCVGIDKRKKSVYNEKKTGRRETKRENTMNKNTNTKNGGNKNDNHNDRDNGGDGGGVVGLGRLARWPIKSIRNVIIESNQRNVDSKIKNGGFTMNAIAKFYIAFRNLMNDESGTTMFETMIVMLMLVVVVVIVMTALCGFVDNSDAASGLLGGALGID